MNRRRMVTTTAVAAFAAVALAGCIELDMDLTLSPDAEISGVSVVAFDKAKLQELGMPSDEILSTLTEDMDLDDLPDGVTVEEFDDDSQVGIRMTYDDVDAALMSQSETATMQFSYTESEITFIAENPLFADEEVSEATTEDNPFSGMGSPADFYTSAKIAITFPGKVLEAEGATISGNRAEWDLRTYDGEHLNARAENPNGNVPAGLEGEGATSSGTTAGDETEASGESAGGDESEASSESASGVQAPAITEEDSGMGIVGILAIIAGVVLVGIVALGIVFTKKGKANAATTPVDQQQFPPQV